VEYVYYAYANNTVSNDIFFRRGTISGASITWGTEYSLRKVTNEYQMYPDVEVSSDGTVYVVSGSYFSTFARLYTRVFKNANNDGSGTWTTSLSITWVLSGASAEDSVVSALTALNSSMIYMISYTDRTMVTKGYLWNTTWSSVETIFSTEINKNFGIASSNNTVYFAYNYVFVRYCKVRDPTTGWGSAETISSVGGTGTGVQLCADNSNGDVYAFWGASANITYCKRSGTWSSVTYWQTSETNLLTPSITCYPTVINNEIAVVWSKGEAGTIYVMFDLLTLAPAKSWHGVATWTASLASRVWSSGTSWTENLQTRIWNWIPTTWYFIPTTDLIDSYNESNYNYTSYLMEHQPSDNSKISAEGQSFAMLSSDRMITSCKFYLYKWGSPTGMAHAVLYAHQGIYGTNSTPTGEALATSDDFDVSTLTLSIQLITFTFNSSQQYVMKANTYYCIAFENPWSGTVNVYNCPLMGFAWGSPTHSGSNFGYFNSSYFPAFTSFDTVFYVYGTPLGGFNLLTRQYITVASCLFDFGTRIWADAATWTYSLAIMAWQNIFWAFYLGTSIWTNIATWGINLSAMMWRDLSWLFYLLPPLPEWVNVAVWILSLRSPEWMLVALLNFQLGAGGIAFLFIAILLLIVIVAGIIAVAYRRPKR
jgi:hypothetical protein